jgi:hypothetical protein
MCCFECDKHQTNLDIAHWTTIKTILKYLRMTKDMFLVYEGKTELVVRYYTYANFQIDRDD